MSIREAAEIEDIWMRAWQREMGPDATLTDEEQTRLHQLRAALAADGWRGIGERMEQLCKDHNLCCVSITLHPTHGNTAFSVFPHWENDGHGVTHGPDLHKAMWQATELVRLARASGGLICPICGRRNISTREETDRFPYGIGKDRVTLNACVSVHECGDCGFEFTDSQADLAREIAVGKHLAQSDPLPPEGK